METKDTMIATLPVKPQRNTNIGMMLSPTIMDFIGTVLNIEKNIGFNIMHSYEDKDYELDEYLNYVNESGIEYNSVFIDGKHVDQLIEIVDKMYHDGFLKVKQKEKIRCECGRVDMLHAISSNAKLYSIKDDKIICNHCGKECKKYNEKSLLFELKDKEQLPSICPTYLKKEMASFASSFEDSDVLVSKNRDNGYSLETLSGKFNIDIDFLWSNYFKLYEHPNQIYIASNHQIFAMYIMSYLAAKTSDKKLFFIANPYLNVDLKEAKKQYEMRQLREYKKLLLLYNLKWQNKNCKWSDSNTTYLNGISETKIKNLYNSMILDSQEFLADSNLQLEEVLFKILNDKTNMQNNIKKMKKLYREGKL